MGKVKESLIELDEINLEDIELNIGEIPKLDDIFKINIKLINFDGEEYEFSSDSPVTVDLYSNALIIDNSKWDLSNERYIVIK